MAGAVRKRPDVATGLTAPVTAIGPEKGQQDATNRNQQQDDCETPQKRRFDEGGRRIQMAMQRSGGIDNDKQDYDSFYVIEPHRDTPLALPLSTMRQGVHGVQNDCRQNDCHPGGNRKYPL
jgi:hypothetical protein